MNRRTLHWLIPLSLSLAATIGAPVMAQHGHDEPGHQHGAPSMAPKTYKDGVNQIRERLEEVGAAIEKGDMDAAHDESDAAGAIGKTLGALALKPDSGVPREKVRDINIAGKELAAQADALHEAVEQNDIAGVRAAYARMNKALETLGQFVAATYYCPMHCEGDKTYAAPGTCPVCSMHLKKQTSEAYTVEVKSASGSIVAGSPATLLFTLKDPRGMQVKNVEIVHEMPLHLLMVSKDLSWYAHEHPELQRDGTFSLTWTFPAGGEYVLFHDFTPKDVGMQVVPVTLNVEGTPASSVALKVDADKPKTVDGYTVTLDTGGPVMAGGETHMSYTIMKGGKPVTDLAPYLGAMGHLVIISQDRTEFVHSHPHENEHEHDADLASGPKVDFEAHFSKPGLYKGWAQFQHMGKVITVPFTFEVKAGASAGAHDDHSAADHDERRESGHDHH